MQGFLLTGLLCLFMSNGLSSAYARPWIFNNPYPKVQSNQSIYYASFTEQPKTLDPARAYTVNEFLFISQIYEPLLEYDYLKRPYQLKPLTTTQLPEIRYLDAKGNLLIDKDKEAPAYTVYTLHLKKGILYQPHPALAKNEQGIYRYHQLKEEDLEKQNINTLSDFKYTGTREMIADDYIYQIKRLANPAVSPPVYGLLSDYIFGFKEYGNTLPKKVLGVRTFVDLRRYPLKGVNKLDDYSFEITLKGQYTQFLFWLAMPFFTPIPWEADLFYAQEGMEEKNLSFNWYPIGTGTFMLTKNNPNRQMVLAKNPNFRGAIFPSQGTMKDIQAGFLQHAGRSLPLIDKAIYTLEKESIPRWNKFLQGYYDNSSVSADSFDQAIHINAQGQATLTPEMLSKKMYLTQSSEPAIFYMGFNMLDNVIGGTSERARKLRQAISIAVNYDEYIAIFYNGRGVSAQGPIPPGIFGFREGQAGINPYVYQWEKNTRTRRSIEEAKALMKQAGYPEGKDPVTGQALILHYDASTTGSPEEKSMLDWMRKQYAAIGIDLNVRATMYNRFQEKVRTGNVQIFSWGWNADYPDPENFLFQLYSHNGKVKFGGENATNYQNANFDKLFDLMKNRDNDEQRQTLIDQMLELIRHDAPWIWGIHPETFLISQSWLSPTKINNIALGNLKYVGINIAERNKLRLLWNQPIFWPLSLLIIILLALIIPLLIAYVKKEKQPAPRVKR